MENYLLGIESKVLCWSGNALPCFYQRGAKNGVA